MTTQKKKRPVHNDGLRVNVYRVLSDCVEQGINHGWYKAHKHTDTPDEQSIKTAMDDAVMAEICDYFDFTDEDENPS